MRARTASAEEGHRPEVAQLLEVEGETCLTRSGVAARLGPLLAATELPAGLRVVIRGDVDGKTTFVVSIPGADVGIRLLDTSGLTCESKLKLVTVTIAVAIDGILESRAARLHDAPPPPPPSSAPEPAPPPPAAPPAPLAVAPLRTPKVPARWAVSLGQGLFATTLGPSAAVVASAERSTRVFGVRASFLQTLGATVDVDPGRVRYSLALGRGHACANLVRTGSMIGRACMFAGVGAFEARGSGFYSGGSGRSLWVDAGASAEADFVLSRRWAVRASAAPFGILRAPTLRVTDARSGDLTASSAVPRIGGLFSLELAFRFGE
ncbi:hypothetical protein AKJ09_07118 [Labilithrix luteola]|uniref:Uncharacterized protein n=1 Tax=Labilithrix luteola TaxID=1391654 RepID=A0A0K1Q4X1_9BACT|nr:hypothetical protein [Labilithrix luteola]AKV00455.1 hypothetical protein AKJ09_07118 [Labilithrix luteola]